MGRGLVDRVCEDLHREVLALAIEARERFDALQASDRNGIDPLARVACSCEALRVTTRLMHVVAWTLQRRGWLAGEIGDEEMAEPSRRLGECPPVDPVALAALPEEAARIVRRSVDLHRRVALMDERRAGASSPVGEMLARLEIRTAAGR